MRCRDAIGLIGPHIDGELSAAQSESLLHHLHACDACSRRHARMRGLVRELSSLPAIVPTPQESYRLMNRLRREMRAPASPRTVSRRGQLAAAALSLLVAATVAGLGLAVWGGRGPATVPDGAALEAERPAEAPEGPEAAEGRDNGQTAAPGATAETAARPTLVISDREYTAADMEGFRDDIGTRLDFYSAYWYPISGAGAEPSALAELQADLTSDLTGQAAAAGHDPGELERAVNAALGQAGEEPLLPCYAELASVDGAEAWIVSVSGPEDYLLFPDTKRPPAFILASLGGTESLKISESLLRELAAMLAPSANAGVTMTPAGTSKEQVDAGGNGPAPDETAPAPESVEEEAPPENGAQQAEEDFRSFLRQLAAQGTSLDLISALKGLSYRQMLMLMHGDWASLAEEGVRISDFLTPPKRLWVVDCASGEVLW